MIIEMHDVISLIIISGALGLKFAGIDGTASMVLVAVVGYYYGHKRN